MLISKVTNQNVPFNGIKRKKSEAKTSNNIAVDSNKKQNPSAANTRLAALALAATMLIGSNSVKAQAAGPEFKNDDFSNTSIVLQLPEEIEEAIAAEEVETEVLTSDKKVKTPDFPELPVVPNFPAKARMNGTFAAAAAEEDAPALMSLDASNTVVDKDGNETKYEWGDNGKLSKVTVSQPNGTVAVYDYNDDEKVVHILINNADGSNEEYNYNDNGKIINLTKVTTNGEKYEYIYGENENVIETTVTNNDGTVSVYKYNNNNVLSNIDIKYADGTVENYKYSDEGKMSAHTKTTSDGTVYEDEYDAEGIQTSSKVTYTDGTVENYSYTKDGKFSAYTKTTSDGTLYETDYNAQGIRKSSKVTYTDGTVENFNYTDEGKLSSYTKNSSDGSKCEEKYNADEVKISSKITEADGTVGNTTYNAKGLITWQDISRPDGSSNVYMYNTYFGDAETSKLTISSEVYPNGLKHFYMYNGDEKVTRVMTHNPDGSIEDLNYDSQGRPSSMEKWGCPDGSRISYKYKDGVLVSATVKHKDGKTETFNY